MRTVRSNQAFSCRAALVTSFLCLAGFSVLCLSLSLLLEAPLECVSRLSSLDTRPYYYTGMASCNEKRTSRKRTFAEEESWFLVQFEDQPDTFRVLNEREVKHLDPEDHEEMQEGGTIQAFWSADKKFYEAEIIKISGECVRN